MDDLNKMQDSQSDAPKQPFNEPQDSNQAAKESTYWESQAPETPDQFYQFYQQQMSKANSTMPSTTQPAYSQQIPLASDIQSKPPKKKGRGLLIAVFVILFLVLAGGGVAYAFQDTLLNTLALYTKSPEDYYTYIEKRALSESVDKLTPYLEDANIQQAAYNLTSDITFDRTKLDSLMKTTMGMGLEDFENNLGIPIESLGFNLLVKKDGNQMSETLGIQLNQVNLITMEIFMDMLQQEMLIGLPELTPAYLKQSFGTGDAASINYEDMMEVFTSDRTADFLNRYGNLIIESANEVELEKGVELSLNTLTKKCSKLTVTLTGEDLYNMTVDVLEEAKTDQYMKDLLSSMNISEEEFQQYLTEAISNLKSSYDNSANDGSIQMLVFVDANGNIISREFKSEDTKVAIGYTYLTKDNYNEFDAYFKDNTGNDLVKVVGSQTKDVDGADGTVSVNLNSPSLGPMNSVSFDITYQDYRSEKIGNYYYQYGSMSFVSPELMGLQLLMDYSVADDIQYNKLVVQLGASSLVTIDSKLEYLEDYTIATPPATAEVFDTTQSESYVATFKVEEYIARLSKDLGVDLKSLFGAFLP